MADEWSGLKVVRHINGVGADLDWRTSAPAQWPTPRLGSHGPPESIPWLVRLDSAGFLSVVAVQDLRAVASPDRAQHGKRFT